MYELHDSQKFMYYVDRIGFGQVVLLCGSIVIPRKIKIDELQNAANEVFRINDGLRTYFIEKDGNVYQDYKLFEKKQFEVKHFNSKEELDDWGKVYATIPLNLDIRKEGSNNTSFQKDSEDEKPSLELVKNVIIHNTKMFFTKMRMNMLNREPACCEIILVDLPEGCGAIVKMHHVVSDAWTMMLVANQFLSILQGKPVESFNYIEFMEREKKYDISERHKRDAVYMQSELDKLPQATWVWPEPYKSLEGRRKTVELDRETTESILNYCKEHNTTPYNVFLVGICAFMNRKMNRDMFYLGSVALNRANYREKNTTGLFVSSFPVLMELDQNDSFYETLIKVGQKSMNGFRHQKGVAKNRNSKKMLYDVWVSYQNATLEADPSAICTQYYCNYTIDTTIFSVEDRSSNGQFKLHFDYNLKIPEADVDDLFATVIRTIKKGIKDDATKLKDIHIKEV